MRPCSLASSQRLLHERFSCCHVLVVWFGIFAEMKKKDDIDEKVLAVYSGLDAEQVKLLCLMAYLGDAPGNYALRQLYGRNYSAAMQKAGTPLPVAVYARRQSCSGHLF